MVHNRNILFWVINVKMNIFLRMSKMKFTRAEEEFRRFLRELRFAKDLTQAELAQRLELPQSYVSKYETGERRLDFVETALVCEALGLSLEEFAAAFSDRLAKIRRNRVR
jgi:ribosome-binding protein aMBF1 (putative translation factor)